MIEAWLVTFLLVASTQECRQRSSRGRRLCFGNLQKRCFDMASGSTQTRLPQGSQDVIEFVSMRQRSIDFEVWSRLSRSCVNVIIATSMSMNTHFMPLNAPRLSLISSTETFIWLNS